ncbi:hypothetical protein K7432_016814 [Basidiobolus ranarum]|uniref:Uncharacterized protein n=1 Tax=Basidiobolus ranarum TaxID=34480 RepID=A0ABR2VL44_9FUNG
MVTSIKNALDMADSVTYSVIERLMVPVKYSILLALGLLSVTDASKCHTTGQWGELVALRDAVEGK